MYDSNIVKFSYLFFFSKNFTQNMTKWVGWMRNDKQNIKKYTGCPI